MNEQDWILYQIGSGEPNRFRFVVTRGFQDGAVSSLLRPGEFIDTTTTLLGHLGGDVRVLTSELVGSEIFARINAVRDRDRAETLAAVDRLRGPGEVSDGELADALFYFSSHLDVASPFLPVCSELLERFIRLAGIEETPCGLSLAVLEEAGREPEGE